MSRNIKKYIETLKEKNDKDLELVEKDISNMLDVPGISKIFCCVSSEAMF